MNLNRKDCRAIQVCRTSTTFEDCIVARTRDSEQNDNSQTAQYEAMDFTNTTKSEEPEADVYLTIPDDGLSQDSENAATRSDSAIKRAEFAEKLASMTDDDFSRQFQVTADFGLHVIAKVAMIDL